MHRAATILLSLLLTLAFAATGARAQESATEPAPTLVKASDARLAGDERRTRLIVDLSGPATQSAFLLADPYRVVVDLPEISFGLPEKAGRQGRGLVSAYRFGLIAPGKSRIVLDLTGPATIDKAFVLDAGEGQPARLVIDLVKADRPAFLAAIASQRRRPRLPRRPAGRAASRPRGCRWW